MKYYVREQLGPKQSTTPEGFLLCQEVPINRTGTMIYGEGETPISIGPDGVARIEREAEEVFRPETIASFVGKPVVIGHPDRDVAPDNWRELTVGFVLDPRRGVGAVDDTLIADFLIMEPEAIQAVRSGKLREVSCGYDADYDELGPGRGRQRNIIGNHVALVENGRCGPRCAIGDQATAQPGKGEHKMSWLQKLRAAVNQGDKAAASAVLDELDSSGSSSPATHVHVHMGKTKDACDEFPDKEEEKEKKEKSEDAAHDKARDAALRDSVFADARFTSLSKDVKFIKDAITDAKKEDEEEEEEERTEDEGAAGSNRKIDSLGFEAPPGTSDAEFKAAKDSRFLDHSFQQTVALCEIIAPGMQFPTFDSKANKLKTYDSICQMRRRALDLAYNTQAETRSFMDELVQGRDLKKYSCDKVRDVFLAVGTFAKSRNNDRSTRHGAVDSIPTSGGGTGVRGQIRNAADLNKRLHEYYANK